MRGIHVPPICSRAGADIRQIQKLLGHRRLSSTEIYTHVELGDLAEVISRCHPREKAVDNGKRAPKTRV
ncbi:MAG: tyrosine-type recombinase/integrase [Acidobacteria bacterium]|nr:tyrosine-type recombinase/integrase [Acidobacteriota bacterium]